MINWKRLLLALLAVCLLNVSTAMAMGSMDKTWADRYAENNAANLSNGLGGWNVLSDDYRAWNFFDGISLEWDYYSIHDSDGDFTGTIGYLVADPQGHLGGDKYFFTPNLMPSGGNCAINGKFVTGEKIADYVNYGLDFSASAHERSWLASDGGNYGQEIPVPGTNGDPDAMLLKGETANFTWDLTVTQMWPERNALRDHTWEVGNDIGLISKEHWTVNMLWPTTRVVGQITNKQTGQIYDIDGHGYRENSFGRWAFVDGGWDFAFMSDMNTKVQWAFQTYHFNSTDLDYLDVDFIDNGKPVLARFRRDKGELGWRHNEWQWDSEAKQCVPVDMTVKAKNSEYTVVAQVTVGNDYVPMLSDVTPITSIYVINCLFPQIEGTITRTATGEVVTTFSGQGGGEFALPRSIFNDISPNACKACLGGTFSSDLPQ